MTRFFTAVLAISRWFHGIAGLSLVFLMLLTCLDVILRWCGCPVPGTYELVGFAGAVTIGFAMPFTSWGRGHVYVDALLMRLPPAARMACRIATRLLSCGLFLLLGWNLVGFGMDLRASGEVSPTLEMRYYPVVFGLAVAAGLQGVVLLCDVAKIFRGEYE